MADTPPPFDPNANYGAPGSGAAAGAPAPGSSPPPDTQQIGVDPSASRTGIIIDNRLIPGSGGTGPTAGSAAAFEMGEHGTPYTPAGPQKSMASMLNLLLELDTGQVQKLQEQLIQAGYLNPTAKSFQVGVANEGDATYNGFRSLLSTAYRTQTDYSAILQSRIDEKAGDKYWQRYQQMQTAAVTPVKSVETSTMLTDPATAQGVLYKTMESELHRAPTQAEVQQFTALLQSTETQNPNVTETTRDPATGMPTRSASRSGIDSYRFPEYAALDYAHTGDRGVEANTTKVATDYMNAALAAVRGPDLPAVQHGGA